MACQLDVLDVLRSQYAHLGGYSDLVLPYIWAPSTLEQHQRNWLVFATHLLDTDDNALLSSHVSWWDQQLVRFLGGHLPPHTTSPPTVDYARRLRDIAQTVRVIATFFTSGPLSSRAWTGTTALENALSHLAVPSGAGSPAPRPALATVFDARHMLRHWAQQPRNSDLSLEQLRLKVICLHALDRLSRISSLDGTMRDGLGLSTFYGAIQQMSPRVWSSKGNAGRWLSEPPIVACPFYPRVCTVAATLEYIRRTEAVALAAHRSALSARRSGRDMRSVGRGNTGTGVPLFVKLPPHQPGALLASTIGNRIADVIRTFSDATATAHRMRHSVASTLIHIGVSPQDVQTAGNWRSLDVLMRTYVHHLDRPLDDPASWADILPDPDATPVQLPPGVPTPLSWRIRAPLLAISQRSRRRSRR